MKAFVCVFLCIAVVGFIGCSSMNITTNYDREADFSGYKTFVMETKTDGSSIIEKNIAGAIQRGLQAKGYREESESNADVVVEFHTSAKQKVDVTRTRLYGRRGRFVGTHVDVDKYKEGTLVLDIIDAKTQELVWQGIAQDAIREKGEAQEKMDEAIKALLEQYPPQR